MGNRLWTRVIGLWLVVALPLLPLGGCVTTPQATQIELVAIVVDGVRPAVPQEAGAKLRVLRGGLAVPVQVPMALQPGDQVETGGDAYAVIRWPSGSELYMRPRSSGVIGSLSAAIGEFFVKVRGVFAIQTEFVRAAATGTAFLVRADRSGSAEVTVFDGEVRVESPRGAWPSATLRAGMKAVAHPSRPQPFLASEAEIQQTRQWVERLEQQVPRPPRVSGPALAAVGIGALVAAILMSRGGDRQPGRGGETAGTPGRDPALAPPARARPGSTTRERPASVDCSRGVVLAWEPVAGAAGYFVRLDTAPALNVSTTSTTTRVLQGSHQWTVQAHAPGATGRLAGPFYFNCATARTPVR